MLAALRPPKGSMARWIAMGLTQSAFADLNPEEATMLVADRTPAPAAIRVDLGSTFVSTELSESTWFWWRGCRPVQ